MGARPHFAVQSNKIYRHHDCAFVRSKQIWVRPWSIAVDDWINFTDALIFGSCVADRLASDNDEQLLAIGGAGVAAASYLARDRQVWVAMRNRQSDGARKAYRSGTRHDEEPMITRSKKGSTLEPLLDLSGCWNNIQRRDDRTGQIPVTLEKKGGCGDQSMNYLLRFRQSSTRDRWRN